MLVDLAGCGLGVLGAVPLGERLTPAAAIGSAAILPVLILCSLAIGCGAQKRVSGTPTIDKIQNRGILLVGTTGDYRPLSYKEPDSGEYWGFGIDMAGEFAGELGVTVSFVPTSWPSLSADVQTPELPT